MVLPYRRKKIANKQREVDRKDKRVNKRRSLLKNIIQLRFNEGDHDDN